MTDRELLQAIYNDTQELKEKVTGLEKDIVDVKQFIQHNNHIMNTT